MIYDVKHRTSYRYGDAVSLSHHLVRLHPRRTDHQRIVAYTVDCQPDPSRSSCETDYFGNHLHLMTVEDAHDYLVIDALGRIRIESRTVPAIEDTAAWENVAAAVVAPSDDAALTASQFAFASPFVPLSDPLEAYARESFGPGRPILAAAQELSARIHADFDYDPQATTVATPVADAFENRHGVCQDFAHVMLAALRAVGLPGRYVSGYLLTHPPEGEERLVGADASHAWVSVWVPGHGWVDIDPTNNLFPDLEHITVAWGRDYGDVNPINGVVIGGGVQDLKVSVDVAPVTEEQ